MVYEYVPERLRSDAPKIFVCAPTMSFAPKIKEIKRKDPKIIRVQKNFTPQDNGGGGGNQGSLEEKMLGIIPHLGTF